jgi:sugar lactone lactonase YvrE/peroxiredoxin
VPGFRWLLLGLLAWVVACHPPERVAKTAGPPDARSSPTLRGGRSFSSDQAKLAPPLTGGQAWLQTGAPLSLERLRGHVVVLDFWTYCCVNCLHVLPELARVEREFHDQPVVVVGVHSGKFAAEHDVARLQDAMARYAIAHPVVVDDEFVLWKRYDIHAWPTLVVIDTQGRLRAVKSGEPLAGALSAFIAELLEEARTEGTLAPDRVAIGSPPEPTTGPLAFPGDVAVGDDGTIAVVDSAHHRVVLARGDGKVLDVVGSGVAGSADGGFVAAAFRRPQGAAFAPGSRLLYVADTANHQIRLVDRDRRRVSTIAGTGRKGGRRRGGPARQVALRSPWGIAVDADAIYVSMAGAHQIWELREGRIDPLAGTGRESIVDGPFDVAAFSQPSGLSLDGNQLYVADAESSAIRVVDLERREVRTLVGRGLFVFGDQDGQGAAVRLQHALDVQAAPEGLYLVDSYNDKLKRLDPKTRRVESIVGGNAELSEPSGVARLPDGSILIADTNRHRLRRFDVESRRLLDFPLVGLTPPPRGLILTERGIEAARRDVPTRTVRASGRLGPGPATLVLDLLPPAGGKLTAGGPLRISGRGTGLEFPETVATPLDPQAMPWRLPLVVSAGASGLAQVDVSYLYCTEGDSAVCRPERVQLLVELDLSGTVSGGEATVRYRAELDGAHSP